MGRQSENKNPSPLWGGRGLARFHPDLPWYNNPFFAGYLCRPVTGPTVPHTGQIDPAFRFTLAGGIQRGSWSRLSVSGLALPVRSLDAYSSRSVRLCIDLIINSFEGMSSAASKGEQVWLLEKVNGMRIMRMSWICTDERFAHKEKTLRMQGSQVGGIGLEPTTFAMSTQRSNQLSYPPKRVHIIPLPGKMGSLPHACCR